MGLPGPKNIVAPIKFLPRVGAKVPQPSPQGWVNVRRRIIKPLEGAWQMFTSMADKPGVFACGAPNFLLAVLWGRKRQIK